MGRASRERNAKRQAKGPSIARASKHQFRPITTQAPKAALNRIQHVEPPGDLTIHGMSMIRHGSGDTCPQCGGDILPNTAGEKSCVKCGFAPVSVEDGQSGEVVSMLPVLEMQDGRDPKSELKKQLRYIENSCRDYDNGDVDEAIRVATQLRTLFHRTRKQRAGQGPMIDYFDRSSIIMLSTATRIHGLIDWNIVSRLHASDERGSKYLAPLESASDKHMLHVDFWWAKEVIYQYFKDGVAIPITRALLVNSATDNDGGAHVDSKLDPSYARLMEDRDWIKIDEKGHTTPFSLPNSHLAALRQIGYEVLNSPSFLELAVTE